VSFRPLKKIAQTRIKKIKGKKKKIILKGVIIFSFFLVEAVRLAHGGLDVGRLEVLPVLLEEGDEVVDGEGGVLADFLFLHANVADAAAEAENLLELELDRGADFLDLVGKVVSEGDGGGELVGTVHVGANNTRDGLDDGLGGEERVEAGAHLLDELLVLVEFLEVFHVHGRDAGLLGLVLVLEVADDADLVVGAADVGEAEGAGEALVAGGIVVLEVDLEINGLVELALLALGEDFLDGVLENLRGDLGHGVERLCVFFFVF
jgi:hypothetical protein